MLSRLALALCLACGIGAIVASTALPARAAGTPEDAALCEAAIVAGARRGGVPSEVLHAIALTETGRKDGGRVRPYPWAINREGKGHWFETRDEALAFAQDSLLQGRKSFDVGCVQINFRWHGHAFPSLEDMFDPEWTATYAAQFLRTLYEERGSWSEAAGAYHSLTPDLAATYRQRFDRLLAGLDGSALTGAETLLAAVRPASGRGDRLARREASRREMAQRLIDQGPAPAPVLGSVAWRMLQPTTGALLVQGPGGLIAPGGALLTAAPGRLF